MQPIGVRTRAVSVRKFPYMAQCSADPHPLDSDWLMTDLRPLRRNNRAIQYGDRCFSSVIFSVISTRFLVKMSTDRGIKQSTAKAYGTRKRTRLEQMKYAREQRQKSTNIAGDIAVASGSGTASSGSVVVVEGGVAEPGEIDVCAGADDDDSVSEPSIASSSQTDVADDGEPRQPVTDDSCLFVQVSSLKKLVENLPCPVCQGDLTVVVIDKSKGPVVGFRTECTTCGHVCSETLSSGRIGNRGSRSPFATTRRMVAGTMDCGVGFSGL